MKHLKPVIFVLCIAASASLAVNAISIRSLLGLDEEESKTEETAKVEDEKNAATQPASTNWGKANKPVGTNGIDLALVKRLMANIEAGKRQTLMADGSAFTNFVRQEANNLSVISAARANKLEENVNTAFLMQRGAENILREIYLNKLITEKLPKDFPTDAQVQEYFDKNQEKFVIVERLHVWQIYFPVTKAMDEKSINALRKKANAIADDIRKKKINFNDAAIKHSKHSPSNANGGYMGLVKSADLKPDIQKVILELAEGKISRALTTDTGIHIVKRGAIVPERKISLEQGKLQIRKLLLSQVRVQLRKAIFEQAALTYPVELSDNKIEEWRLRLRTNLDSPASK